MQTLKTFRRGLIASFFASLVMAVSVMAADMRTVAVVSIADLDTAIKNLKTVTTEAGFPDAMAQAEMMLPMMQGFDAKQPIGIVIQADDKSFGGYGFLPISDLSAMPMTAMLVSMGEKQPDGSILLPPMNPAMPQFYVKQSGKWAFVSLTELPKTLPSDPAKLLEGMDKQYLLGVKANVANLPKETCLALLENFRRMAEMGAQSESDLENIEAGFKQLETLLDELKTFSLGIKVDSNADIIIDSTNEAVAGSVLAADIQSMANFKTNQIGFYQPEGSIFTWLVTGVMNAMGKQQCISQLNGFFEGAREGVEDGDLGPDEIAAALTVLDNVKAMLDSTIESGKIDLGCTWQSNATVLLGATIEEGGKFQEALEKSLIAVPEEFQDFVTLNSEEYAGYKISTVAVPTTVLPQEGMSDDLASRTITLQIAVKDSSIALALGLDDNVLADLKKAIDASKSPAALPKTALVFTPANLVDFLTLIGPTAENEGYEKVMAMVQAIPPTAQITSTMVFGENTQKDQVVISGQLMPAIGQFVAASIEAAQKTRQQMMDGGFQYDEDEIEIDEFDF